MKVKKIAMLFAALSLGFVCAGAVACSSGDGDGKPQAHDHVWSQTYSSDDTYHWQECTVDGCTVINNRGTHTYGSWEVTVPATVDEDGEEVRECTVCGYEQTRTIPATGEEEHTHSWSSDWTYDENNHWHECSGCEEVIDLDSHTYGSWQVTIPATADEDGEEKRECTVCGYEETRTIPATGEEEHTHSWSSDWTYDENNHWHECSGCEEVTDVDSHTYGGWIITNPATFDENGSQYRECSVCHYKDVQTILPHTPATEWSSDENGHWHACTTPGCSETTTVEEHDYGDWKITVPPTEDTEGEQERECSVCHYVEKQSIPATGTGSGDITEGISDTVTYASAGNESAAFEWTDSKATGAVVSYKLSSATAYTNIDNELIRQISSTTARADVLGLKGGESYDFLIKTSGGEEIEINDVSISAYDRSGYAHFNYSEGVGAYNDDGTLKSNAVIVYVTEETKNTVTAKLGGKTYTGIGNIMTNLSKSSDPVVIRIIGQVSAATWNEIEYNADTLPPENVIGVNGQVLPQQNLTEEDILKAGYNTLNETVYSKLNGLTNRIKYDSSKDEFDSYYNMCDISGAENVTVEGVGEDAKIFQWGFTWKSSNSIEVRNLTFDDYTEDACSFEGSGNSSTIDGFNSQRIWVHHNTINEGKNYWDVCSEQDKHEGDGGTDFKYNSYITLSYNHYYMCHKTGLVGGSDSQCVASITFHHNWYEDCGSRLPLGRQANMHMYNNYYDGSTGTNMSLRAGAYAFIENCYFDNANNPITTQDGDGKIGVAKVYNCTFSGKNVDTSKYNVTIVSSRTQEVDNDNVFSQDFDTNSSVFYYANGKTDVTVMHETSEVPTVVPQLAGTLHRDNNILDGTATTPGGEGGDEGEGETGGDTGTTTPVTYTVSVSGTTLNNSDTTGNFVCEVGATTGDTTKYSVESDRINIKGNAAYIKLTIKASQGQTVDLKVTAANGGSNNSSIVLTATNVTDTTDKTAALGSQNTYLDSNFSYTVSADGTVEITIMRVSGSSTVYVSDIVVTVS